MRIALLVSDTLHWLAGSPTANQREHSWASDFRLTPNAKLDVAQFVDGAYGRPFDRGGLVHHIRFSTTRTFATASEAELYALDLDATAPRNGILIFEAVGVTSTYRQMAHAVVSPPSRRLQGATLHLDYEVRGGGITAWTPTPPP